MTNSTQSESRALPYLIVGAGPSGLTAARALKRKGIPFEVVERHSDVGGIWDIDNPGSPMYETCHFITSKLHGGFLDYPMPDSYPTYPSWRQVLNYIKSMARDFNLLEHIRFGINITSARPTSSASDSTWEVVAEAGPLGEYRGIIYAGGQQWSPYMPDFPKLGDYQGTLLHSSKYKKPEQFAGKSILVVGAGNSGADIASDAAEYGSSAVLSTRRPYYFLPKQIFGVPTPDLLVGKVPFPSLPHVEHQMNPFEAIDLALATIGPLEKYGLTTPDWPLGATQPIVSDTILHHFTHGRITHKPNIAEFTETGVIFEDGSQQDFDVVVLATGFDIEIPWLDADILPPNDGHPEFLLGALSERHETLYGIGVLHPSRADAWALFDQLTQIIVADILARDRGEKARSVETMRTTYRPNLKGNFPFIETRRNINQADTLELDKMLTTLRVTYGLEIPTTRHQGFYSSVRIPA